MHWSFTHLQGAVLHRLVQVLDVVSVSVIAWVQGTECHRWVVCSSFFFVGSITVWVWGASVASFEDSCLPFLSLLLLLLVVVVGCYSILGLAVAIQSGHEETPFLRDHDWVWRSFVLHCLCGNVSIWCVPNCGTWHIIPRCLPVSLHLLCSLCVYFSSVGSFLFLCLCVKRRESVHAFNCMWVCTW